MTFNPWYWSMNLSSNGQGVICGRGVPVRSESETIASTSENYEHCDKTSSNRFYSHNTARISPWKSVSMKRVLRRKARAQEGSRCSMIDSRCESEEVIDLRVSSVKHVKKTFYSWNTHICRSAIVLYLFAGHLPLNEIYTISRCYNISQFYCIGRTS